MNLVEGGLILLISLVICAALSIIIVFVVDRKNLLKEVDRAKLVHPQTSDTIADTILDRAESEIRTFHGYLSHLFFSKPEIAKVLLDRSLDGVVTDIVFGSKMDGQNSLFFLVLHASGGKIRLYRLQNDIVGEPGKLFHFAVIDGRDVWLERTHGAECDYSEEHMHNYILAKHMTEKFDGLKSGCVRIDTANLDSLIESMGRRNFVKISEDRTEWLPFEDDDFSGLREYMENETHIVQDWMR